MQKTDSAVIDMSNVFPLYKDQREATETTKETTTWNGWMLSLLQTGCDSLMTAIASIYDVYLPAIVDRSIFAYDQGSTISIEEMRDEEEKIEYDTAIDKHNKIRDHQLKHKETLKAYLSQNLLPHIPMQQGYQAYARDEVVKMMIDQDIISFADIFSIFRTTGDSPINLEALFYAIANSAKDTKDVMAFVESLNPTINEPENEDGPLQRV